MRTSAEAYNEYLDRQIEYLEESKADALVSLKRSLEDQNAFLIVEFGLSKYAEKFTVITAQLKVLYEAKHTYNKILASEAAQNN